MLLLSILLSLVNMNFPRPGHTLAGAPALSEERHLAERCEAMLRKLENVIRSAIADLARGGQEGGRVLRTLYYGLHLLASHFMDESALNQQHPDVPIVPIPTPQADVDITMSDNPHPDEVPPVYGSASMDVDVAMSYNPDSASIARI